MAVLADAREPTEGIRHEQPNTTLYVRSNSIGQGTLYITESVVTWLSSDGKGVTLPYPNVILHAVSRDTSRFPHECLYVHTDAQVPGVSLPVESEDDEDEMLDECPAVTELYFVPEDKDSLNAMFHAMASCQALHPDPQDEFSPDEDFFEDYDEEDVEDADSRLARLNLRSNGTNGTKPGEDDMDAECFEDAEDDSPEH